MVTELRPWLIGAAAAFAAAVLAAGIVVSLETKPTPPVKYQARATEPLPPTEKTPQQRINEAWDALYAHSMGYR